jgi:hypothetical protein
LKRPSFTVDADALVTDCPDTQIGARWPWPVHQRLDGLFRMAKAAGARPSRAELIAAIVCAFPADPEALTQVLTTYRTSIVRAVALDEPEQGNVVRIAPHGPGRRRDEGRAQGK